MCTITPNDVLFRKGKRVILRPLNKNDAHLLQRWVNDPAITQYLNRTFPCSLEEELAWLESLSKRSQDNAVLGIATHSGELVGTMGLHKIDWINRVATTGALIGSEAHRDQGYGTEAKMLLLDWAFHTLNLRKIYSHVIKFNGRSIRYSEKCGYAVEGMLKKHVYRFGTYHDEIILAVFYEDWLPLWKAFQET